MKGLKIGTLGAFVLIVALVAMVSGCAFRGEWPAGCDEEKVVVGDEEWATKASVDDLDKRVTDLENRVTVNEKLAADAMDTAEKALKCCRKEFVVVLSEEVYFAFNSSELDAESTAKLDRVAEKLKMDPDYIIEIAGHTDAIGNNDYNIVLGQKRAGAVRSYLADRHQIDYARIAIRSGGEEEPVATNDEDAGRAKNRRATVSVLGYSLE